MNLEKLKSTEAFKNLSNVQKAIYGTPKMAREIKGYLVSVEMIGLPEFLRINNVPFFIKNILTELKDEK